jgi:hypothetical protein
MIIFMEGLNEMVASVESFSDEERFEYYQKMFLEFVSDMKISADNLVYAWKIFYCRQVALADVRGLTGATTVHLVWLLNKLEKKEYFDPTTASVAVFPMKLSVVKEDGELPEGSILIKLPAEKIEGAVDFCVKMIEVGEDPRLLNEIE